MKQELIEQPEQSAAPTIDKFLLLVQRGIDAWREAGAMLAAMVDSNPNTYRDIMSKNPAVSVDMLLAFEKIGRKKIYPQLLLDNSPGAKRLLALPYELQEKYCTSRVPVLTGWVRGKPHVEEKSVQSLSGAEVERVFFNGGIRAVEEQKALLPEPQPGSPRRKNNPVGIHIQKPADRPKDTVIGYFVAEVDAAGKLSITRTEKPVGGIWNYVTISFPTDKGFKSAPFCIDKSC